VRSSKSELLIGGVGLVKGSLRNIGRVMFDLCNELEPEFERTGFLDDAPFQVVHLMVRFGTKWGEPDLGRIIKRHSELEVGIEVPMSAVGKAVRRNDMEVLDSVVRKATLRVLVAVAQKYELNGTVWEEQLASLK